MQRLVLVVVSLVVVGCHEDNPASCELPANAGMGECPPIDAATDGPPKSECTMNNQCTANPDKAVCDTAINGGTCVQCTAASHMACKDKTPICTNDACVRCNVHTDCMESKVCMPDGSCANAADVAYLDGGPSGSDQMMCTQMMPCTKIENAAMAKSILKISGTLTERATLDGKNVVILVDPGAKLTPTQDGAALDIRGNSMVQIYDLEISHMAGGQAKDGISVSGTAHAELTHVSIINNTAAGARVTTAGQLTCTHCTIAQNTEAGIDVANNGVIAISQSVIKGNSGGGIAIGQMSKFQIVGNFIFGNGGGSALAGGIAVQVTGDSNNHIDFNSVSHNNATGGIAPGINCVSGMTLTAKYNIVWNNGAPPYPLDEINVAGCPHTSSSIGPFPNPPGTSNFSGDPGFRDETGGDLHLRTDSIAIKKASPPAADLGGLAAKDIDDEVRALPVDLGADQAPR